MRFRTLWHFLWHPPGIDHGRQRSKRIVETSYQGLMKASVTTVAKLDESIALTKMLNESLQQADITIRKGNS